MRVAVGVGAMLVAVVLGGCTSAPPEVNSLATRKTSKQPIAAVTMQRRAMDLTNRLWAAGISMSETVSLTFDVMAPFGIEHSLTLMIVEGVELKIYKFWDGSQSQQAARQLVGAADLDSLVLDNLLVVVPKGEAGARILAALR